MPEYMATAAMQVGVVGSGPLVVDVCFEYTCGIGIIT